MPERNAVKVARSVLMGVGSGDGVRLPSGINVNIPNLGQMADVPIGAVFVTNALFRRDSVTPVIAGKLPNAVHSLVIKNKR